MIQPENRKLNNQIKSIISVFVAYYVTIHENTDARNSTQLASFIRRYGVYLKISEKLLKIIPMLRATTIADIFDSIMKILIK